MTAISVKDLDAEEELNDILASITKDLKELRASFSKVEMDMYIYGVNIVAMNAMLMNKEVYSIDEIADKTKELHRAVFNKTREGSITEMAVLDLKNTIKH